jgi:large subunit ribosomal protein L30
MEKETKKADKEKLAIVRVRGLTGVKYDIDETLKKLGLNKKNYCVVVPKTASYMGMIKKVKDYVAWGNIDEELYNTLVEKRGEEYTGSVSDKKGKISYNKFIDINGKKIKKIFRLNSPKKGYGRKGIKVSFSCGGALGYRGDKIKELIERMI